jgi:uncharacterized sporulation protein YeaH/YhbH (DUF444 family)
MIREQSNSARPIIFIAHSMAHAAWAVSLLKFFCCLWDGGLVVSSTFGPFESL